MKKLFLLLMFCSSSWCTYLKMLQDYADRYPELVENVSEHSVYNPDYTRWYMTHAPSIVDSLMHTFRIKQLWPADETKKLLTTLTRKREDEGYGQLHDILLNPKPGSQCIMLGPLFGSFHSLVRVLTELHRMNYITADLTLTKPNTYIVFVGNVIDESPYILETLTIVLKFLFLNPTTVFYLSGQHERDDFWKGFGLKREIALKIGDPLFENSATRFFKTLPRSFIIKDPSKAPDLIAITFFSQDVQKYSLKDCMEKAQKRPAGTITVCPLIKENLQNLDIKAVITGEQRLMSYRQHRGLVQVPAETGALTWSLFSAPNALYRKYFYFYYDAFSILTVGQTLAQSVISLYNEDVRELTGFKRSAIYGVLSGEARIRDLKTRPGENVFIPLTGIKEVNECSKKSDLDETKISLKLAEKKPIIIGCTLDLSKGASVPGKHVKEGMSLRVNEVNRSGGIDGHPIKVIFMDDEYSPEKARVNVEHFIESQKSTLFLCNLGSANLESYLDLIKKDKVFLFFPITSAPIFRKPDLIGLVHWTVSYKNEAKMLTEYMIKEFQIKDFGFFYQNDSYGTGGLEGAREVLKDAKLPPGVEIGYERNTTQFKSQLEQLKAKPIGALGLFSNSVATIEFIRQAGVEFFVGKKLFALSDLSEESFTKFARQKGLDLIIAQFSPNPVTSNMEIVRDFRIAVESQGYSDLDIFTLEGYVAASFALDIMKKAWPSLSHASLLRVINGMQDYHYKGFTLTFDPKTRELAHKLWLNLGNPEWLEVNIGKNP